MMNVTLLKEEKMQSFFMRDSSFFILFSSHLNKHLINVHLAIREKPCLKSQFMGHLSNIHLDKKKNYQIPCTIV